MEIRKQLSETEIRIIKDVSSLVGQARAALAEQEQKMEITQKLLFDRHEVPEGSPVTFDDKTGDLVFTVEDTPAAK